jgi:hypothetical protein
MAERRQRNGIAVSLQTGSGAQQRIHAMPRRVDGGHCVIAHDLIVESS